MSNKPTHIAYTVRKYTGKDGKEASRWLEIGSAWANQDGKGFDVHLDATPVNGRLVLRVNEPKPATRVRHARPILARFSIKDDWAVSRLKCNTA